MWVYTTGAVSGWLREIYDTEGTDKEKKKNDDDDLF